MLTGMNSAGKGRKHLPPTCIEIVTLSKEVAAAEAWVWRLRSRPNWLLFLLFLLLVVPSFRLFFLFIVLVVAVLSGGKTIDSRFRDLMGMRVAFPHGFTPPLRFEYTPHETAATLRLPGVMHAEFEHSEEIAGRLAAGPDRFLPTRPVGIFGC